MIGQLGQEGRAGKPRCTFWVEAEKDDWNWVQKGLSSTAALPWLPQDCPVLQPRVYRAGCLGCSGGSPLPGPAKEFRLQGHQRDRTQAPPLPKHALAVSGPGTAARAWPCLAERAPLGERPCPLGLSRVQAQWCLPPCSLLSFPSPDGTLLPSLSVQSGGALTVTQHYWWPRMCLGNSSGLHGYAFSPLPLTPPPPPGQDTLMHNPLRLHMRLQVWPPSRVMKPELVTAT